MKVALQKGDPDRIGSRSRAQLLDGVVRRRSDEQACRARRRRDLGCVYLSAVVLAGLVLNALLGWWWADSIAALGVIGFLVKEGGKPSGETATSRIRPRVPSTG